MESTSGFLLIDKPKSITSHDVIDKLRKITGIRKIGHAGTLDPFATGLLIVAVERAATKEISRFVGMDKTYETTFILGATTESLDTETEVVRNKHQVNISDEEIFKAIESLTGTIDQIPPMHSAIKVNGKKLYQLARKGKEIERKPRTISIHSFELLDTPKREDTLTTLRIRLRCSSGTYVRAIARDLAEALGTTGYTKELRRTFIYVYDVEDAAKITEINEENWRTFLKSKEEMHIDA
jgi:tRNA pseudouridine55 synthase